MYIIFKLVELLHNLSPGNSRRTLWGTTTSGWPCYCQQQTTKMSESSQINPPWNECKKPDLTVSPLQSAAGCRKQVRDQPGHLSQGAFCIHWHRWAGLPHHRRGQHSQRWCTNSPWCESRDYVSLFMSLCTSYPPELHQGHPRWSMLKAIPTLFISLPLHSVSFC